MNAETWLHPNRRALWFGCIPPLAVAAASAWLAILSRNLGTGAGAWIGAAFVIFSIGVMIKLARQLFHPRIAYRDGEILFNLRRGAPIAVPVQIVEAFFLGQGPAKLPGDYPGQQKTVNLVARLAQRHTDWAHRDVKQELGNWSDGYVTIRGTWCEPLNNEVVRRLNRRLKEVKSRNRSD